MTNLDFGSSNVRRMPVYLVIGCGESMAGAPIREIERGIQMLLSELLRQPDAMEMIWLSAIAFADSAKQVVPLTSITKFSLPSISAKGRYNLGAGLRLLVQSVYREIIPTTTERKGDYKPLVFLIFDNEPTDRWERELGALNRAQREGRIGNIIALGYGKHVNFAVLRQITESVLLMSDLTPDTLSAFFKWTSASVTIVSKNITSAQGENITFPQPPSGSRIVL